MLLNHPDTIPHPSLQVCGKVVSYEIGPWCQKGWGPLHSDAQHLSCPCQPSACLLWKNVCGDPLLIFLNQVVCFFYFIFLIFKLKKFFFL